MAKSKGQERRTITEAEFQEIIQVMREGRPGFFKPNKKAAMALVLEANLGIRISDITGTPRTKNAPGSIGLRLCDIIRDGDKWRLSIVEQKTGKDRVFVVPEPVRSFIVDYCYQNGIGQEEPIVGIARRSVQDALKKVTDYLELERVGTHSFRKFFATRIYENTDHDVELVRDLLQHESLGTTQRYLRSTSKRVERALQENMVLI